MHSFSGIHNAVVIKCDLPEFSQIEKIFSPFLIFQRKCLKIVSLEPSGATRQKNPRGGGLNSLLSRRNLIPMLYALNAHAAGAVDMVAPARVILH